MDLRGQKPWCPACTAGKYEYADADAAPTAVLCGRDAVQIRAPRGGSFDLAALAERLSGAGTVIANEHLLRFSAPGTELIVFRDGRAMVKNVRDVAQARSVYARYVGI